jgi:hypothetical protein
MTWFGEESRQCLQFSTANVTLRRRSRCHHSIQSMESDSSTPSKGQSKGEVYPFQGSQAEFSPVAYGIRSIWEVERAYTSNIPQLLFLYSLH